MIVKGTYFQNSEKNPLVYGDVEIHNIPRRRLRGEEEKEGIIAESVFVGFCGTDYTLMNMGREGNLKQKFPEGCNRLINGHEGVVWVPDENRFAIVLIRGGNSYDPTRYTEEETYFEYGCDQADGLFSDKNYYNPDMLLKIPDGYVKDGKIPLSICKKLVFSDPYACMIFQRERMEDIGEAQNFRVKMAQYKCSEAEAREIARKETFDRVCIFGLGTTGMFIGDLIHQRYPDAKIVFVARSEESSPKVSFALKQAGASYVGSAFDTMPFGFKNQVIFGSINFRQDHMEEAIRILLDSCYDEIVELIDKDEFTEDPVNAYENKIYAKGAPMKTAVIWNEQYII